MSKTSGSFKEGRAPWNKDIKGICKPNSTSYKKGHIPWSKGRKFSEEHKRKLSESTKGRKAWNKGKKRINNWKGGKRINNSGYWSVYKPEHSRAYSDGYIPEHILVAEKMLGRPLKYYGRQDSNNERVHHIDGNKLNNNPENLFITKNSEHRKLHHQLQKLGFELIQKGIINFNKEKKVYEL